MYYILRLDNSDDSDVDNISQDDRPEIVNIPLNSLSTLIPVNSSDQVLTPREALKTVLLKGLIVIKHGEYTI